MKELICPECHKLVRTAKDSCPNCGFPFKNIQNIHTPSKITEVPIQQIKKVYIQDDKKKIQKKRTRSFFSTETIMVLTIMFGLLIYTFLNVVPSIIGPNNEHILATTAINNLISKFMNKEIDYIKTIKFISSIYLIITCSIGVLKSKSTRAISCFMTFILFGFLLTLAILGYIYSQPPSIMYYVLLIITIVWIILQLIFLTKDRDKEIPTKPIEVTNEETEGYIKELEHINELLQKRIITESEYKKLKTKIINTKIEGK